MEYLFLSTTGLKRIDANDIFHNFRQYKKDAGIIKKCTLYVLRHTFAAEMVKKGVDIFTLQRMMGHKNITTTRQYVSKALYILVLIHNIVVFYQLYNRDVNNQ